MFAREALSAPEKIVQGISNLVSDSNARATQAVGNMKSFIAADLDDGIRDLIYDTAMNAEVSQDVITKAQTRLSVARKGYLRFSAASLAIFLLPHLIAPLLSLFTKWGYLFMSGHEILGPGIKNALVYSEIAVAYFAAQYFLWRKANGLARLVGCLTRSLASGLKYHQNPTNTGLRDRFAVDIQLAAMRYADVFKRSSGGSHLFAIRLRKQAKHCRNDILSLIPALVTADCDGIAEINRDLTRLLIRSQLGYWYQTQDIAKYDTVIPQREAIFISASAFFKDRSIQIAFIALIASFAAAVLPVILNR